MRCKSCNKDYTSKFSFVTESICQSCFNKMSDPEKRRLLDDKDKQDSQKAVEITIKQKKASCPICQNTKFWKHPVSADSVETSLFGFDSINHQIETYTCEACGYLMWFVQTK